MLYAPPGGEILMKRLFVQPEGRGLGLGISLVNLLDIAKSLGYTQIKLDTLPRMSEAIKLYTRLGFIPTTSYYDTPMKGTVFLVQQLEDLK